MDTAVLAARNHRILMSSNNGLRAGVSVKRGDTTFSPSVDVKDCLKTIVAFKKRAKFMKTKGSLRDVQYVCRAGDAGIIASNGLLT